MFDWLSSTQVDQYAGGLVHCSTCVFSGRVHVETLGSDISLVVWWYGGMVDRCDCYISDNTEPLSSIAFFALPPCHFVPQLPEPPPQAPHHNVVCRLG